MSIHVTLRAARRLLAPLVVSLAAVLVGGPAHAAEALEPKRDPALWPCRASAITAGAGSVLMVVGIGTAVAGDGGVTAVVGASATGFVAPTLFGMCLGRLVDDGRVQNRLADADGTRAEAGSASVPAERLARESRVVARRRVVATGAAGAAVAGAGSAFVATMVEPRYEKGRSSGASMAAPWGTFGMFAGQTLHAGLGLRTARRVGAVSGVRIPQGAGWGALGLTAAQGVVLGAGYPGLGVRRQFGRTLAWTTAGIVPLMTGSIWLGRIQLRRIDDALATAGVARGDLELAPRVALRLAPAPNGLTLLGTF
jgi:hypothetical protein